jgi:hypothetical protein
MQAAWQAAWQASSVTALLGILASMTAVGASDGEWTPVRNVGGVTVEARPTASGFDEHRGTADVCTDLSALEALVADTERFPEWLPYTRQAELRETTDRQVIYYVRTTTPWPLKDRDMVYRITRQSDSETTVHLNVVGLPDYEPKHRGATRIREASGHWEFVDTGAGLTVSYQLFVDPGPVPAIAANGRLASAVGETLANLADRFPCTQI